MKTKFRIYSRKGNSRNRQNSRNSNPKNIKKINFKMYINPYLILFKIILIISHKNWSMFKFVGWRSNCQ